MSLLHASSSFFVTVFHALLKENRMVFVITAQFCFFIIFISSKMPVFSSFKVLHSLTRAVIEGNEFWIGNSWWWHCVSFVGHAKNLIIRKSSSLNWAKKYDHHGVLSAHAHCRVTRVLLSDKCWEERTNSRGGCELLEHWWEGLGTQDPFPHRGWVCVCVYRELPEHIKATSSTMAMMARAGFHIWAFY